MPQRGVKRLLTEQHAEWRASAGYGTILEVVASDEHWDNTHALVVRTASITVSLRVESDLLAFAAI